MVSVVPSIIPILTANAVAANQVKRKNKSLNNDEKKLKDSPLNDKINCRVFLNNGKVIEGHYEGNWYEDNSDEEGIWIKTDNGIEEINSKDYDRIEYYHKKTINESYIKAEKGNIYYTKNSDMFLSMVKSIFISKNIPVRVYYDTIKQMYVFGNAFDYIHADLATGMKYYSKIYGIDEMRANVSYLRQNCALFQVLPDDDFKKYDMGDGYTDGWFLKLDDLIFACRHKQYHKVRDEVPLFKDHISEWIPTDYYIAKKQGLTESVDPKLNNNFWKWFGNSKVVDKKEKPLVVYHGSGANNIQEFDPSKGFNVDAIYFSDKLSVASHWSGDYLVKKKVQIEETEDVNKLLKTLNEFVKAKIVNYDGYYRLDLKYDDGNESSSPLGEKIDDRYYQKGDGTKTDLVKILQRDIETFAFKSENSGNYACYLSIQKPLEIYAGKKPYWKIEFMGKEVNTETIASYAKQNGYDGAIIYDVYETDYENQLCNDYIVFDSRQIKSVYNNGEWSSTSKNINESVEEKIIAYHGSQHKKFNFRDDKVLYLTTDKKKAESYAKREWDEGLIEGEIPVVYTFEISVKNPYVCHTENEFQSEFCDVNMNLEGGKEELIEKGYDSIKYKDLIGVFSSSQIKLVNTEVLPPSMDYYYPKDTKDGDEDINDYYYDEEELDESVQNDTDEKLNSKTNCKIVLKDGKTIYGHLLSVNENYVYINSNNGNRIKKDNIKELYMYYDCEVITKNGKTIYGNFVGDFGDHKLHLDDSFNKKGWAIKDKMIEKVNYKKVIKHTFDTEKLKNYSDDIEKMINKTLNESYTPDWIQDLIEDYSCYEILEMFRNGENLWNNLIQPEPYKKALSEFVKYGELLHFPKDKVFDWFKIIVTNTIKMTSMSYLAGHEGGFPFDDVKDFLDDDDLPDDFSVLSNILEEKGFYAWSKLPNGDISWSDYGLKPLWNIINEYNDNMSAEEVLVLVNRALDVTHWNGDLSSAFIIGGAKTLSKISNESINKKGKIINESVKDKILYIIRGVPGSGKSTLAHKLTDNVVEADQYFYDDKGNYNWSADKLNQAHNWCFYTVKKYMEEGRDKIAVANTFVKNRDYKRYVELAKEFGYKVDIRTCTGNYQNIHNVPDETVEKMRSKFQETPLDESAENDKTLRDYAVKLANICLDALVKTKYKTLISNKQIQINVDKAFKKAVPMLKNSPYEYFIILVSKNDELYASYGKTVDKKYGLITLPVFSKDPIDQTLSILYKHKSMLNKLYSTYSGDELKLKINEYAIKYLKKELEKSLSNVKSEYIDILIHECTHLLDDVRRTKTYNKSKEQNLKDDKGIETYYNSPEEQNAYYQETVSIFDEYAENKLVGYKTFDIFWDDFIRQYRGEYNMLNDKNKRKLKKRAYAYWYVYMKD